MHPYGESITILRPSARNKWGDVQSDAHHSIDNVAVDPTNTSDLKSFSGADIDTSRDGIVDRYTLYLPLGSDILAGDQVELMDDPDVFKVIGRPRIIRRNPITGDQGGVIAHIERVSA